MILNIAMRSFKACIQIAVLMMPLPIISTTASSDESFDLFVEDYLSECAQLLSRKKVLTDPEAEIYKKSYDMLTSAGYAQLRASIYLANRAV